MPHIHKYRTLLTQYASHKIISKIRFADQIRQNRRQHLLRAAPPTELAHVWHKRRRTGVQPFRHHRRPEVNIIIFSPNRALSISNKNKSTILQRASVAN